jgi:hypothetical protein
MSHFNTVPPLIYMEGRTSALPPTNARCPLPHAQGTGHQASRHYVLRITFHAHAHGTRHASPNQPNTRRLIVVLRPKGGPLPTSPGRPVNPGKDQVLVPSSRGSPPTKRSIPSSILAAGQAGHGVALVRRYPKSHTKPSATHQQSQAQSQPARRKREASAARVSYRHLGHSP